MIRIEKDRILSIDIDLSNEPEEIYPSDIPAYLGDTVELGEFVTFYRIFDLIVDNKALFNTIFAKDLGQQTIEEYLEEYNQPVTHTSNSYDLEVHIVCQAHNYSDYQDFEYYVSFHGVGVLKNDTEAVEPYPISLMFTSLNELKNKYVRLNNTVQVYTFTEDGSIERSVLYDGEIKLFDFFAAILNEISFFGDPEHRDEVSGEVAENVEAVERGEDDFLSLEEVQEQWAREEKEAEEEEERVRLESLREQASSGYIKNFIETAFQEILEKLEMLEKDLVSLERYEDAKLVRARIDKLNNGR